MSTETPQPETDEPTPATPVTRRQRTVGCIGSSLAFVVVYVGLAGPVAWLHNAIDVGPFRRGIEIIYAPVVFIVENKIPPFAGLIKAWIEWFA